MAKFISIGGANLYQELTLKNIKPGAILVTKARDRCMPASGIDCRMFYIVEKGREKGSFVLFSLTPDKTSEIIFECQISNFGGKLPSWAKEYLIIPANEMQ
jgi:hypothetical protein